MVVSGGVGGAKPLTRNGTDSSGSFGVLAIHHRAVGEDVASIKGLCLPRALSAIDGAAVEISGLLASRADHDGQVTLVATRKADIVGVGFGSAVEACAKNVVQQFRAGEDRRPDSDLAPANHHLGRGVAGIEGIGLALRKAHHV
ncbi:hypothetical protein D3C76_964590 [compost metagenome]